MITLEWPFDSNHIVRTMQMVNVDLIKFLINRCDGRMWENGYRGELLKRTKSLSLLLQNQ